MELKCIVVTPERTVLEQSAMFVALPLYDGEYGIALSHTPMIGRLGSGELRIQKDGQIDRYYVSGGFVEVLNNTVSLLTDRATPMAQITLEKAEAAMEAAKAKPFTTPEETKIRNAAMQEARVMQRFAKKATH
ncbi:MAG: ATP synthase F1 subunit epsilon [Planctomycetia bacterium]|nr:ATP synthase F1 subunit epsilon [Planctomycetia bacterium]